MNINYSKGLGRDEILKIDFWDVKLKLKLVKVKVISWFMSFFIFNVFFGFKNIGRRLEYFLMENY